MIVPIIKTAFFDPCARPGRATPKVEPHGAAIAATRRLMRRLEICRSGNEWYLSLEGTFVVGFMGRDAEQRAREQLHQLKGLLDLHTAVSTVSTESGANGRAVPSLSNGHHG
jgi:hypothetical protein